MFSSITGKGAALSAGAAALTAVLAACGSSTATAGSGSASSSGSTSSSSAAAASGSSSSDPLRVSTTSLGKILVDSQGRTVYLFKADSPGHSVCNAACLHFWPIVAAPAGLIPSMAGITAKLGTTTATNGQKMLTADGWPLYTFVGDHAAGDVKGQGLTNFGGAWLVLTPAGQAITGKAPASKPSTSSSGGGGGGY